MIYLAERSEGGPASTMSSGAAEILPFGPRPRRNTATAFFVWVARRPLRRRMRAIEDMRTVLQLLSFVLSRLCLSILCGYEADVSTRQLQESHYAMSTASIING